VTVGSGWDRWAWAKVLLGGLRNARGCVQERERERERERGREREREMNCSIKFSLPQGSILNFSMQLFS
jgi:hypothetical protein